jgi:RTX calcium-binding nonapeptide repeat (4 copies)
MAWQTFAGFSEGIFVNVRGIYPSDAFDQITPNVGSGNGYYNYFWQELTSFVNPFFSRNPDFPFFYNANFNGSTPLSYNNTPPNGGIIFPISLTGIDKIVGSPQNDYIQTGADDNIILGGAGKDIISLMRALLPPATILSEVRVVLISWI